MVKAVNVLKSTILFSSVIVTASHAQTINTHKGPIALTWLNDVSSGYSQYGEPSDVVNVNEQLPAQLLTNIYSMLPEARRVNPSFVDGSLKSNIVMDDDFDGLATVSVTFLNEGAGYRNSLGYFLYDPNNPPTDFTEIASHNIIFPNASKRPEGRMDQGDSVDLGITLTGGQALGFFVVPNGWGWNGSGGNVTNSGSWNQPFYSLPSLNPEPSGSQYHNVIFYDSNQDFLVVGFDDQHRFSGDNDFNDLLFAVDVTPIDAVAGINSDGSVDASSYNVVVQTENTEVTSTSYYPSRSGYATLMYEDNWPRMGDYDFNDLVVKYRYQLTLNNVNALKTLRMSYQIQAIGAAFHNGFALHLPGVEKNNVSSATLTFAGQPQSLQLEAEANEAVIVLTSDTWDLVSTQCSMYRTLADCNESIGQEYVLEVQFSQPVPSSVIGNPPYDPFIFASPGKHHGDFTGRGWEVHLKNFGGTSLFDNSLLGTYDDNSNFANKYVNNNNFPWVLNITDDWAHPLEGIDITKSYPDFSDWVLSNGNQKTNWYMRERASLQKIY
jgi:LruC domain-containing protein